MALYKYKTRSSERNKVSLFFSYLKEEKIPPIDLSILWEIMLKNARTVVNLSSEERRLKIGKELVRLMIKQNLRLKSDVMIKVLERFLVKDTGDGNNTLESKLYADLGLVSLFL